MGDMSEMYDYDIRPGERVDNTPYKPRGADCHCRRCRGNRFRTYTDRETIGSRTDDLRHSGASERGGGAGGGAPFVKWGDDYTWLEGEVTGSFTTKYGLAVTLKVVAVSENGVDTQGMDEDGNRYEGVVTVGQSVNIGTQSATLKDKIVAEDVGKTFHVAFEGWDEGKQNRYRCFTVIDLGDEYNQEAPVGGPPDAEWDNVDEQADSMPF